MCQQARLERSSSYKNASNNASDQEDVRQLSTSVGSNGLRRTCLSPAPDVREYSLPPVVYPKHLFTCTVGRMESIARSHCHIIRISITHLMPCRYSLSSSEEVADMLAGIVHWMESENGCNNACTESFVLIQ